MIHFDWPWVAVLLPLPFILRYLMKPVEADNEAALRVPFLSEFSSEFKSEHRVDVKRKLLLLAVIAWFCLVAAGTRPLWLGEFVEIPVSGRDLMLAVDLSKSMIEEDFIVDDKLVNRLYATQAVAGEFIERRIGDRLGLILFGEQAYLQTPLTFDRTTVRALLDEAAIGLAGALSQLSIAGDRERRRRLDAVGCRRDRAVRS